jgi:transposase-like protein
MPRKKYDTKFKVQVVLETLNPTTTTESIRIKYGLSKNAIGSWRKQFFKNAHKAFEHGQTDTRLQESPEELKKIIGELTIENSILKKISKLMN